MSAKTGTPPATKPPSNMSSYATFYIVRHAESEANKAGIRAGQIDFDLSDTGVQQAIERARELKRVKFSAVYSSDLLRAKRTAEIIGLEHTLAVQATKLLRERKWGKELEGKTREETERTLEVFHKMDYQERLKVKVVPDMESDEEIISRFITFLRETAIVYPNKTILIVSHANLIRTFLAHIGYGTHQELSGALKPTGYVKVRSDGVEFIVEKTKGLEKKIV